MYEPQQTDVIRPVSIGDMLGLLRKRWWIALPPLVLAIGLAVVVTLQTEPTYSSEAEVLIRTEESANLFPLSDETSLFRSPSAEEGFLASTEFEQAAIEAAGGDDAKVAIDVGDVTSRVEPSFITFRAEASDAVRASEVAQSWAETYVSLRHELDAADVGGTVATLEARLEEIDVERTEILVPVERLDSALQRTVDADTISRLTTQRLVLLQSVEPALAPLEAEARLFREELAALHLIEEFFSTDDLNARVNRTAETSETPVSPSLLRNLLAAVLLGLVAGAGAMLLAEALDDRVNKSNELTRRFGLESLTVIPHRRSDDQSTVATVGPVAEGFHRLASAIDFRALTESETKVLMFTSARPTESKTTTVSRLGTTLARQGRRTLLIGADMRRPSLASRFDHKGPGLGEVLGGLYPFGDCVHEVPNQEGLFLLGAGTVATEASPVDLLRNENLGNLIEELRPHFDHILIDCPPVLPVVDALEVAKVCDGIVLNAFAGRSRFKQLEAALSMVVQATNKPILGFVLTGAKSSESSYRNDYYYSNAHQPTKLLGAQRSRVPATSMPVTELLTDLTDGKVTMTEPVVLAEGSVAGSGMPLDEVSFDMAEANDDGKVLQSASALSKGKNPLRFLKMFFSLFLTVVAVLALTVSVAPPSAAQSYEGESLEDGILTIPDDLGPGSSLRFAVSGLVPNSELTFVLTVNDEVVDGLEVSGAIVVRADGDGNYAGNVLLPSGLDDGTYTLTVSGLRADGTVYERVIGLQVEASALSGQTATEPATQLALTGSSSNATALNGLLIIGVGVALVAFAARKQAKGAGRTSSAN